MSDTTRAPANVRPYVFFDEQRPTRTWLPTLEMLNERFAQHVRTELLQHLQPAIDVIPDPAIELLKHNELIDGLATPSHLTLVTLKPLVGTILLVADLPLVGAIVESRFGGNGRIPMPLPNREFTPLEQQAMRRVILKILQQLALAWQPVTSFAPEIVRFELKPAFALVANSTDLIIVSHFDVRIANGGGRLTIAIPYLLLEPLHERLVSTVIEKRAVRDERWARMLGMRVGQVTTLLNVELASIEMTVGEFLALQPGHVFEIERPEIVTVQAHGVGLFRGSWGRHGRKIAVKIEERLAPPTEPPFDFNAVAATEVRDDER